MRPLLLILLTALCLHTAHAEVEESVALEGASSLRRAVGYLVDSQAEDGLWSKHAGITGAAILALAQIAPDDPDAQAAVTRGLAAIVATAQEDGSFAHPGSKDDVYSTSMCILALSVAGKQDPALRPIIERGAKWLAEHQKPAGPGYGGAGFRYTDNRYPDLSNTQWAAEALFVASYALGQTDMPKDARRMLEGAVAFISSCQVKDGDDAGAFSYFPPDRAEDTPHDSDVGDARIWGSLTYGALKTMRYGGIAPADDRVAAGIKWTQANDTVKANIGLDDGGYYYYLYMYATTRNLYRSAYPNEWQRHLVEALLSRQRGDGHWENKNPLWLERDAALCTAYASLAIHLALQP